jgi:alkylhydroperoxidase family enzyme
MKPMFLREVEVNPDASGSYAGSIRCMQSMGVAVPGIMHMFAYNPEATQHLERFAQAVMRGPSPLSAGFRELIAAFTSRLNHCAF